MGMLLTGNTTVSFCRRFSSGVYDNDVKAVAWSPNGSQLATISEDNATILWDAQTGAVLFKFVGSIIWFLGIRMATGYLRVQIIPR